MSQDTVPFYVLNKILLFLYCFFNEVFLEIDTSFISSKNSFDYSFCDLGKSAGSVKSVVTVAAKGKASIKTGKN